jgi:hypothetical protein
MVWACLANFREIDRSAVWKFCDRSPKAAAHKNTRPDRSLRSLYNMLAMAWDGSAEEGKTLIDLESVDEYHASLPRVETRAS